jgi:uncharacterized protein (TIGR02145 family)
MDVMVDADGNYYNTVQIGNQIWIVENLRTTKYNDGTPIPTYTDMYEWKDLSTGAYCWHDNDKTANAYAYGALYNWYAVETGKLCPAGWHVPSDDEVKILEEYVGVSPDDLDDHWRGDNAGSKLAGKASLWNYGSLKEDAEFNSSGFTAVPGGYRRGDSGAYVDLNGSAHYWTSTPNSEDNGSAWYRAIVSFWTSIERENRDKGNGYSVRCLKD